MSWWYAYTGLVKRNCIGVANTKDLSFWRNNLFAGTLVYLLPLCFIALLPGLYFIFFTGQLIIAIVDMTALLGMAALALIPGIAISLRKMIFLCFIYLFGFAMIYFVGLAGPGLLYLLMAGILNTLILPGKYKFLPAWLNTFICFIFAVALWFNLIAWPQEHEHSFGEWVAVSVNLVFLSFLASALIPQLFNGLQDTINEEAFLNDELGRNQESLHQALKMLEDKNKDLEQFTYVASHDLKEPLRMITSFMGMLKSKYDHQLDEKAHVYIDFAIDGGKRMQKMIADLLELSHTDRHLNKETTDINEVIKEVRLNILNLIEENRADVIIQKELPVLAVYKPEVIRLFQNLISNSIKFRKKDLDPVIIISAMQQDKEWLFCVGDNGIGIAPEKFEKVFDVFVRLHSHETYEGTGIGLSVCKKVVEHHGGRIWAESLNGEGTTFYFTIKI